MSYDPYLTLGCFVGDYGGPLLSSNSVMTYSTTTTTGKPVVTISGSEQGNSVRHWAQPENKEHMQVANIKAYRVIRTDGTTRTIEATQVVESNGRLNFLGSVEGYESHVAADSVASLLADTVVEYGLVPVLEEEKAGSYTYAVKLVEGGSESVTADQVLYTRSSVDSGSGQFTFVTNLRHGRTRTEFLIGENKVDSIARVTTSSDESVSLPAPSKSVSDTASA